MSLQEAGDHGNFHGLKLVSISLRIKNLPIQEKDTLSRQRYKRKTVCQIY